MIKINYLYFSLWPLTCYYRYIEL